MGQLKEKEWEIFLLQSHWLSVCDNTQWRRAQQMCPDLVALVSPLIANETRRTMSGRESVEKKEPGSVLKLYSVIYWFFIMLNW
jgi:hypothetical protein